MNGFLGSGLVLLRLLCLLLSKSFGRGLCRAVPPCLRGLLRFRFYRAKASQRRRIPAFLPFSTSYPFVQFVGKLDSKSNLGN